MPAWFELDVHPALVRFGVVLQSQFLTDLFDFRFDLLHMTRAVVSLAYDDVKVVLAGLLRISYPLLQDLLCFFYILPVEVDGVTADLPLCVVLAEDEFGSLFVDSSIFLDSTHTFVYYIV